MKNRFCEIHWNPHLNKDPRGIFIALLVEFWVRDQKAFIDKALELRSLDLAYYYFSPLCCNIEGDFMDYVYEEADYIYRQSTTER